MNDSSSDKGRIFESVVADALTRLQQRHPSHVFVEAHPQVPLYDGSDRIPDFSMAVRLPFGEFRFLIECQNRKRSTPAIAEKIFKLKSLSEKNRVIFVHATEIPPATRQALEKQGDTCMQQDEFTAFLGHIAETIDRLHGVAPPIPPRDDDDHGPIFQCLTMR